MKFKKIGTAVSAMALSLLMACGSAAPAYAFTDENAANESAVIVEENTEATTDTTTDTGAETATENTENTADQPGDSNANTEGTRDVSGVLTPDGSLTLVDDVDEETAENLQFMTVTTRDGSYYYIIIDRSGSSDNVYFLNAVDAVDLMNLMSDDEKAEFAESDDDSDTTEPVVTPTVIDDGTDTDEVDPDMTQEKTDSNSMSSSLIVLIVFVVLGAMVAGGYYMLKIKPKKEQGGIDEDREFYDDEDFVNEDVVNEDETSEDDADDSDEEDVM